MQQSFPLDMHQDMSAGQTDCLPWDMMPDGLLQPTSKTQCVIPCTTLVDGPTLQHNLRRELGRNVHREMLWGWVRDLPRGKCCQSRPGSQRTLRKA